MRPSVASRLRRSRPAIIGFSVLALVVLTVSYAFAATIVSFTFDTTAQGWTGTGLGPMSGIIGCTGGCFGNTGTGAAFDGTSPTFNASGYPNGTLVVTFFAESGTAGQTWVAPTVSVVGGGSVTASGCTSSGMSCSASIPLGASPSASAQVLIHFPVPTGATGNWFIDTVTISGTPAGGVMSFPALDLGAVSTQMGGFFSFIAPALWVAIGISLGGYIAAKVRGIL